MMPSLGRAASTAAEAAAAAAAASGVGQRLLRCGAQVRVELDGRAARPDVDHTRTFHPMMLAHPIDLARDLAAMAPGDFQAEWKWDGIRVQVITYGGDTRVFSRTGDDITRAFPDLADSVRGAAVLDGELLVGADFQPLDFNCLQQRLNRKTP